MQYNVAQLMKERTGATRKHHVREAIAQLDPEIVACSELAGELRLMRTVDGVLVTGCLRTSIEATCDRCLTTYGQPVTLELEDEFKPSIDIVSGASLPVAEDESDIVIDAHHVLDLQEVVRQRILLSKPLHPLCRSDCRGLCIHCGANLNEEPCHCESGPADPRWGALQDLLREG